MAVVGHARPDGDCIGSQVALARVLTARGSQGDLREPGPGPAPPRLRGPRARPSSAPTRPSCSPRAPRPCSSTARTTPGRGSGLQARFPRPAGTIDHHLSNEGFAEINIVDSNSAAACEILAGVFLDAGLADRRGHCDRPLRRDRHRHRAVPLQLDLAAELCPRGRACRPGRLALRGRIRALRAGIRRASSSSCSISWRPSPWSCGGRVCIGTLSPRRLRRDGHDGRGHGGAGRLRAVRRRRRHRAS